MLSIASATKKSFGSFDEMIKESELPVLVDFYATWCGPCQMLSGALSNISVHPDFKGKLTVVKIDSEKYPNLTGKYGVKGLPTMILFKNGEPVDRLEGFLPEPQLMQRLKYFMDQ